MTTHATAPAVVSVLNATKDGASTEIAVVGNEGVVGVPLFTGGDSSGRRAVVRSAGEGLRMKARTIDEEFDRAGPALPLLLRHSQALVTQIAQTAVCNRHHGLDQQLCRWLLMSLDRLQASDLVVTHELIAHLLGVRREGVTESAARLHKLGLIRYARGHVRVLDRKGLEERVCECYRVLKSEHQRLLPESCRATSTTADLAGERRRVACVRQRTELSPSRA